MNADGARSGKNRRAAAARLPVVGLALAAGSLWLGVAGAAAAPAGGTGGAEGSGGSAAIPGQHVRHAPIVGHRANVRYSGPVYELNARGEVVPYVSPAQASLATAGSGGAAPASIGAPSRPKLLVPGIMAKLIGGQAAAPMEAPLPVKQMVWAANRIVGLPYIFGGGHASFRSPGYDCSGTVSFALHGASMLASPEDSTELEGYGQSGVGQWVTIFANSGHAYMDIAGLRLDTSSAEDPSNLQGPRWRPLRGDNSGFTIRHPVRL